MSFYIMSIENKSWGLTSFDQFINEFMTLFGKIDKKLEFANLFIHFPYEFIEFINTWV